jgi:soluble lytic murein transglycosylase-like protein
MMGILSLVLLPLWAQAPPPAPAAKSGIELQRESVRKQMQSAVKQGGAPATPGSFFTYSWTPTPLAAVAPPDPAAPAPASPTPTPTAAADAAVKSVTAACDPIAVPLLDPIVKKASQDHGVESALLRAVIEQESAFRPCAVSPKGAQGLMQLMPATAAEFQVTDPFDPEQSVQAGTRLLKQLLEKYKGNLSLVLSAYNAGPARVDKDGGIPDVPETQEYVRRILAKLGKVPEVQSF